MLTLFVALHALDDQLESLRGRRGRLADEDVLPLAHEYDIAVLQVPPVPDLVYRRNREELNDLWQQRQNDRF